MSSEEKLVYEKERFRNFYLKHRRRIIDRSVKWWKNNRIRHRETGRLRHKRKWENNLQYRIKLLFRHRLKEAIRRQKSGKNVQRSTSIKYAGCSMEDYIKHIESQFYSDMSWENYGKRWHIDHIIPCELFDFQVEADILNCFHYSNCFPLLATVNVVKNDFLMDGVRAKNLSPEEKRKYISVYFNADNTLKPEIARQITCHWKNYVV